MLAAAMRQMGWQRVATMRPGFALLRLVRGPVHRGFGFRLFFLGFRRGPAVMHCFTGSRESLKMYLDMGLHIGITGWICDERRGKPLRELVRDIPLNRLMIETDAPFLVPRSMATKSKDGRNEPGFLPHILQAVADCVGKSIEEVARATTATAREFFRLEKR